MMKNMQITLSNIPVDFLEVKTKNFLFLLGLNEKYISFNYLTWALIFLIKKNSSDRTTYRQAILWLVKKYNVSYQTIIQGLHKITSMCDNSQISSLENNQLIKLKTLNKIRIIKNLAENFLCENLL